jgi:hypothetical protein
LALRTTPDKILVDVNPKEKDFDKGMQTAKDFSSNYSSRNPIVCKVVQGNDLIKRGVYLLAHYNFFGEHSPFRISETIFALKVNENIFARLDEDGNPHSMFGNIMCERIPEEYSLHMPPELQTMKPNEVRVISNGSGYRKGQVLLIETKGDMEVIYNWRGEERKVIKVKREYVVGLLKPQTQ